MRGPTAEQEQRQSVRERPILFSGPMVRAIIDGRKTQTRRVVSDLNSVGNFKASELLLDDPRTFADGGPSPAGNAGPYLHAFVNAPLIETRRKWERGDCDPAVMERLYPRYQVGDRLWVRETFWDHGDFGDFKGDPLARVATLEERIEYRATEWDRKDAEGAGGWKPSIHMPRWASRLTLEITEVRVERLQEISNDDAQAEGINMPPSFAVAEFRRLWDSLNAKRGFGWTANPFVWVISFQSPAQTATSKKAGGR